MQNKIDEIMKLIEDYGDERADFIQGYCNTDMYGKLVRIQDQLKLLVRKPLSDAQVNAMNCVYVDSDEHGLEWSVSSQSILDFARAIERAHGIV